MNYEKILYGIFGEESTSTFWSGRAIHEPKVYRLENQWNRFYYTLDPVIIGTSVTTWLDRVKPTPYFLLKWYRENGPKYVDEKMHLSSNYGTCCHIAMSLLLRDGEIDLSKMDQMVDTYWRINEIEEGKYIEDLRTKKQWVSRLQNDMICLLAFIQERNVVAHAIEYIGFHRATANVPVTYGCAIDLIVELDWRGKRQNAIIDWKTGGLYDDQGYQLLGNLMAFQQDNDLPIDLMFNLSPKKAANKTKYALKERKIEDFTETFHLYAQLAGKENFNPKPIPHYGVVGRNSNLDELVVDPVQYIKKKHEKNQEHVYEGSVPEYVHKIRHRYQIGGVTQKQLAEAHGLSQSTVSLIINKKIWSNHVTK